MDNPLPGARINTTFLSALFIPVLLLPVMAGIFALSARWLSAQAGYLLGFGFYWLFWCLLLPRRLLGKAEFAAILRDRAPLFSHSNRLAALLWLTITLVSVWMYAGEFLRAPLTLILLAAPLATVNGFCEEILWRGLYVLNRLTKILFLLMSGLFVVACTTPSTVPSSPSAPLSESPSPTPLLPPVAAPSTPASSLSDATSPPLPPMPFENRVFREGETYILQYQDARTRLQYRYTPLTGSLHDLQVVIGDERPFLPSNYGGPRFLVEDENIPIWETEPQWFTYTPRIVQDNILEVAWQVRLGQEIIPYIYRFSIQGKTLRLEVESPSTALFAFTLDRSEETPGGRILLIPYLPLFNLLLYRQHFLSAYFDWEATGASRLEPMNEAISDQSLAFSQTAYYLPNTAGERRPLHEVIYLTVSDRLDEVLPRLPASPSPYLPSLAGKTLLDLWAKRPFAEDARLVQELGGQGIADLIVLRHNWQRCGYDDCYPSVLPANPRWGGDAGLIELSTAARQAGDLFALHENYVDVYPNADDFSPKLLALTPEGQPVPAWFNRTTGIQSFLLSPPRSQEVAARFSPEIHRRFHTSAVYLDVSTAVNPSEKVDYNAAVEGNARLRTTLEAYRRLLEYVRQAHQSPVIGEGGHHALYAGVADAVLAEDAGRQQPGALLPPLVHFDLLRIHPHMVRFGMGFYPWYFAQGDGPKWFGYTAEEHYRYMAYEIAFCHGPYIPTPDSLGESEHVVAFIEREVTLVAPVHRRCALARPLRILYHLNGQMVGVERALIEDRPWQVFVEYDNRLQVWVNLHPSENWPVSLPQRPSWTSYSALVDGLRQDCVGTPHSASFILPPNGWVAAEPP